MLDVQITLEEIDRVFYLQDWTDNSTVEGDTRAKSLSGSQEVSQNSQSLH